MEREPGEPSSGGAPAPSPALAPVPRVGEIRQGVKPGTRYVRVTAAEERPFRRTGASRWQATLAAERPTGRVGRVWAAIRRFTVGVPLASARGLEERLDKVRALAIFSSDAVSSSAYATEEILLVLVLVGSAHLNLVTPISFAIAALLVTVVISYQQTIRAYPGGGGAYSVASENLGRWPGLVAASALLTDYILTVAVSISAGVLAIVSALPELADYRVEMAAGLVVFMAIVNLRGLRESGTLFAIPAYLFIFGFAGMLALGLARLAFGDVAGSLTESGPPREAVAVSESLTIFIVLRAFSSGAVALTGVEAIANGVTAFKPPEARNAAVTMRWMAAILATFFIGSAFLAMRFGVVPVEGESVISQLGRISFGGDNFFYYYLQATTALILVLAANTAFNGFPRLSSMLARDGFMPHQFAFRGDKLAFSYGIVALAAIAIGLLVMFSADTHRLIPLYAVGVFISFTLSQAGMVRHWRETRERNWRRSMVINGAGAIATGVVAIIVATTKFTHGAWIILILIPAFVLLLRQIRRHYDSVHAELAFGAGEVPAAFTLPPDRPVVVPVGDYNRVVARALSYARGISTNVTAIHVSTEEGEDLTELEERWHKWAPDIPLVIIESPYRSFQAPFIAFIDALPVRANVPVTVVIPDFVPAHWWQGFLHNQTAMRLRAALYFRPDTIVVDVTQQLER